MTSSGGVAIRPAAIADRERLFDWANDPQVRANAFSTDPIGWEAHCEWFDRVRRDPRRLLFIITLQGPPGPEPVGQVRFDLDAEGGAEISIALGAPWRGQGVGAEALRLATALVLQERGLRRIRAFVKASNDASRRAFLRAGYRETGAVRRSGAEAIVFERTAPAT